MAAARAAAAPALPLGARVSEGRLLEAAVFALRRKDVDGLRVAAAHAATTPASPLRARRSEAWALEATVFAQLA
eukprot:SAG31_NODE_1590_length_7805_cov_3.417390_8_plen_74_part_00